MKKIFLMVVGSVLILIGALGVLVPILPGWPLLFVGLTLVAPRMAIRLRRNLGRRFFSQQSFLLHEWEKNGVRAGFTTRHFPLVLKKTDDLLNLSNQEIFKKIMWKSRLFFERDKASSGKYIFLNQAHGGRVVALEDETSYANAGFYHLPEADGVITNIRRLTLLVMTADCLSIFFCVKKMGRTSWIGLVHAGWRGTRENIASKALQMLLERSRAKISQVRVAFGPSIGSDHYEVGPEFETHFGKQSIARHGDKLYFDLAGENRRQLLEAGIAPKHILDPKMCTVSDNKHFYSYRREKDSAGRIISFITKL